MTETGMVRKRITYYGAVQGVGFRYTAARWARLYGLTGYVRNNYDGSVTLEIQGRESMIFDVQKRIHEDRYIRIEDMETERIAVIPEEASFGIR